MARIRCIKPELPADKTLAGCSRDARYTFLLIISQADDYGLMLAEPRQLLGHLYPHDADVTERKLEGWVAELVAVERIVWRSTTDGARVLEIANWAKHQQVKNPGKPLLLNRLQSTPETLPQSSVESTEILPQPSVDLGGAERERERERERDHVVAFEAVWKAYPPRPNNVKVSAFKAWSARVREGVTPDVILDGVKRYAAYVRREKTEGRFIKQAATFFGPDRHWESDYTSTAPRTAQPTVTYPKYTPPKVEGPAFVPSPEGTPDPRVAGLVGSIGRTMPGKGAA